MQQSRLMSLAESVTNVVIGYVLAIATQIVVFPWFGIETGLAEHMTIGLAFVGISLARGFLLRRLFEAVGHADKEYADVAGADHYYIERPELLPQAVELCSDWISRKFG